MSTSSPRFFASLFVALAPVVACAGALSIESRPCPCTSGWTCCAADNVCMAPGQSCPSTDGNDASTRSDGTTAAPTSTVPPRPPFDGSIDAPTDAPKVIPPGVSLATTGACASRAGDDPGTPTSSTPDCTIANAVKDPGTGFVSFVKVPGDRGDGSMTDGALLLRCANADKMLFQAVIRCFKGAGDYTVAPGDLVLGGLSSDRSCRLSIGFGPTAVSGFIDCPNTPEDPDDIFASSTAPIGLGAFVLPRTF